MIVLSTLNARYIHAAVGLRYLYANLGELRESATILEFEASQPPREIVEAIVSKNPSIVGFGVYIWNAPQTCEVISLLKKVLPHVVVVIGGPEVSYEYESQPIVALADYLITGEADQAFAALCQQIVSGRGSSSDKVIHGGLPDLKSVSLPYAYYTDTDIKNRVIYVEVSRGCPFTCEFCLSSLDIPVRQFDHEAVLTELDRLYARGARTFKFVDRTFNLHIKTSLSILQFFLDRMTSGLFVHFEMVPDRFPPALREIVAKFPPGSLQLEIGVQSLNPEVGRLISRRQDIGKLLDNLKFLRTETSAHLHVDLIVGLPGEGLESFGQGFNVLVGCEPQEIQIGVLKKLRGTPIVRHSSEFALTFTDYPPYEIVSTRDISFQDMQRMQRFARYWDLVGNSGNFIEGRPMILGAGEGPFRAFLDFTDWSYAQLGRRSAINLKTLTEIVFRYLTEERKLAVVSVGEALSRDYQRGGRSDLPAVLKPFRGGAAADTRDRAMVMKRQQRAVAE